MAVTSNSPFFRRLVIAGIVTISLALWLVHVFANFVVIDESGHLAAGLSHWQTGVFRAYWVNPPVPRMLATLPIALDGPVLDYISLYDVPGARPEFELGRQLSVRYSDKYLTYLRWARLVNGLWFVLGMWIVYRWATELFGPWPAVLALALWCFEPTIIAMASVVIPDMPAATSCVLAAYCYWRFLNHPAIERSLLAGLALGLALTTKVTLLILLPLWLAGGLILLSRTTKSVSGYSQAILVCFVGWAVLCTSYGFRGMFVPLKNYTFISEELGGAPSGNRFGDSWLGDAPVPVPKEYLCGIDSQMRDFSHFYPSYLRGRWQAHGWWYYYLYAMAVKIPLGHLVLLIFGAIVVALRRIGSEWVCLLGPPLCVIALVSSQTGFTHHLRYILPAFPLLFVAAASVVTVKRWQPWVGFIAVGLVVWSGVRCVVYTPHLTSHFNEAVGGPANGHEHLLESCIDWGQDLLRLRSWIAQNAPDELLYLVYDNVIDPSVIGISTNSASGTSAGPLAISIIFRQGGTQCPDGHGSLTGPSVGPMPSFMIATNRPSWVWHPDLSGPLDEANELRKRVGAIALAIGIPWRFLTRLPLSAC